MADLGRSSLPKTEGMVPTGQARTQEEPLVPLLQEGRKPLGKAEQALLRATAGRAGLRPERGTTAVEGLQISGS